MPRHSVVMLVVPRCAQEQKESWVRNWHVPHGKRCRKASPDLLPSQSDTVTPPLLPVLLSCRTVPDVLVYYHHLCLKRGSDAQSVVGHPRGAQDAAPSSSCQNVT